MIDRARRYKYAELLRHFAAGLITNDDYVDHYYNIVAVTRPGHVQFADDGLRAVFSEAWFLYSDVRTHKVAGKRALSPKTRREVARWILFLYSECEYQWPTIPKFGGLWNVLTLGHWGRNFERQCRRVGDYDYWPFRYRHQYEEALRTPRLLAGAPSHDA